LFWSLFYGAQFWAGYYLASLCFRVCGYADIKKPGTFDGSWFHELLAIGSPWCVVFVFGVWFGKLYALPAENYTKSQT
jgi:hypothetical protein